MKDFYKSWQVRQMSLTEKGCSQNLDFQRMDFLEVHSQNPWEHINEMGETIFSSCILKIASRCNIRCKYCYMYELVDQSWVNQPKVMQANVIDKFLENLSKYLSDHNLDSFVVVLHGGEPLLAGIKPVEYLLKGLSKISNDLSVNIVTTLQTNGILLNDDWVSLFKLYSVLIGVSHDGPAHLNDLNRVTHSGEGTERIVSEKIKYLQKNAPEIFTGVLTVINPNGDGAEVVDFFYNLKVPKIDFLFPDQNHLLSPVQYPSAKKDGQLYSNFLDTAYKRWRQIDDPDFDIRLFRELVLAVMGKAPSLDSLGVSDVGIFVVETDGGLEPIDTFKCCGDDFTKLELNILTNSLQDLESNALIQEFVKKSNSLSKKCLSCEYIKMCGGGYMPHRFNGNDFLSPSVYCDSLYSLCETVQSDIHQAFELAQNKI